MQYVSNELFHFVGRHEPRGNKQFELLAKILRSGTLVSSQQLASLKEIDPEEEIISANHE